MDSAIIGIIAAEIAEVVIREPETEAEDFNYVKQILLNQFKLSPEDF